MKNIGFIGLGVMGAPMAGHLLSAGYGLRVWNRTASKGDELVARGATPAASPSDAARGADPVITMVADDAALRQVAYGAQGLLEALPPGGVHLSMSTVSAAVTAELAQAHHERGSQLLAVPVFGSRETAIAKKLWAVAAGDGAAFQRCRPLIEAMASGVTYLGEDAAAAAGLKLIVNLLISSAVAGIVQAFTAAGRIGLPAEKVMEIIHHVFNSIVYERYGNRLMARDFSLHFPLKLMLKDLNLVLELGASAGVPLPHAAAVREMVVAALGQGYGDNDAAGGLLQTWETIAVPGKRRAVKENTMKKAKIKARLHVDEDTMRPEYDFSKAVRGVTAARYAEGSNVVLLDPDVAEIFPNARAVNEALRTFARLTRPPSRPRTRKHTA